MSSPGLYQQVLREDWEKLSPVLQAIHGNGTRTVPGKLSLARGRGCWLNRMLDGLGFPKTVRHVPSTVCFSAVPANRNGAVGERLARRIGTQDMVSQERAIFPFTRSVLTEAFGPLSIRIRNEIKSSKYGNALWQYSEQTHLFGCPLPRCLSIQVVAVEWPVDERRFRCHIYTTMPLFGKLLNYFGEFEINQSGNTE